MRDVLVVMWHLLAATKYLKISRALLFLFRGFFCQDLKEREWGISEGIFRAVSNIHDGTFIKLADKFLQLPIFTKSSFVDA